MDKTGIDKSSACGGKDLWCPECRFHNRKKCVVLDQDLFGLVLILDGGLRRTRKISMERGISGLGSMTLNGYTNLIENRLTSTN